MEGGEITKQNLDVKIHVEEGVDTPKMIEGMGYGRFDYESSTILFSPEKPNLDAITVIIPGFGHQKASIGEAFEEHAKYLAKNLNTQVALALPNTSDEEGLAAWMLPGLGYSLALLDSIEQLDKVHPRRDINVVVFSGSCWEIARKGLDDGRVRSITFVAPSDNPYDIVSVFREIGSKVEYEPDGSARVGRRGTIVIPAIVKSPHSEAEVSRDLKKAGDKLRQAGVKLSVLVGEGDPIVKRYRSNKFAESIGVEPEVVRPVKARGSKIHDFDDDEMREAVLHSVLKN